MDKPRSAKPTRYGPAPSQASKAAGSAQRAVNRSAATPAQKAVSRRVTDVTQKSAGSGAKGSAQNTTNRKATAPAQKSARSSARISTTKTIDRAATAPAQKAVNRKSAGPTKSTVSKAAPQSRPKASAGKGRGSGAKADAVKRGWATARGGSHERRDGGLFLDRRSARARRRANATIALDILFVTVMLCLGTWFVFQARSNAQVQQMKAAVSRQTFYEGVTVEGVNVSGMTLSQAADYFARGVEADLSHTTVTIDGSLSVTAAQLGYESDYLTVLKNAWNAGRSGSLQARYQALNTRRVQPVDYSVHRRLYDGAVLDALVGMVAQRVNMEAKDASLEAFDASSFKFTFSEERAGRKLDADALRRDIASAMDAGGGAVNTVVEILQPTVTSAEVSSQYGMISSAVTNASSSSKARLSNIRTAMAFINGTCVKPGEEFSFNKTVGRRTTERGFKLATAYSGGEVTEQVGGGICQVSTTLFNAAVKADMDILERHNHSLTVAYVDRGKDATVNWGNQDFRFKNTSDDDVYVCCILTDDRRVRFGIFGKLLPNGESITVETVTTETIKYETKYEFSAFLAPGETNVVQPGRNGYVAQAYKVRWNAAGEQISRELLCTSRYQMKNEIIQYGK